MVSNYEVLEFRDCLELLLLGLVNCLATFVEVLIWSYGLNVLLTVHVCILSDDVSFGVIDVFTPWFGVWLVLSFLCSVGVLLHWGFDYFAPGCPAY